MSLRGRLLNRRMSRRTLGSVVIGLSLALSASSVHAVEAAPGGTKRPGVQKFGDPVKGTKAKSKGRPANATAKAAVKKLDKPVWPGTGSAELAVPTAGGAPAAQVKVGGLPVTVTTPKDTAGKAPAASFKPAAVFGSKQPGKVQVDVVAPERAAKLGAGALLRVQRADQAPAAPRCGSTSTIRPSPTASAAATAPACASSSSRPARRSPTPAPQPAPSSPSR